jgi:hypothetical protein
MLFLSNCENQRRNDSSTRWQTPYLGKSLWMKHKALSTGWRPEAVFVRSTPSENFITTKITYGDQH